MTIPRNILLCSDFEASACAVEDAAVSIAAPIHAKITLLHVLTIPPSDYVDAVCMPQEPLEDAARRALGEAYTSLVRRHADSEPLLLVGGDVAQRIVDAASERGMDLVVMGTHRRRGVRRALIGSVARRVLRTASCPVLVVPSAVVAD